MGYVLSYYIKAYKYIINQQSLFREFAGEVCLANSVPGINRTVTYITIKKI